MSDEARKRAADRVARARSLASSEDAAALYRDWAADYDRDVEDTLRFTGGARIATLLAGHLAERDTPVIDLGCGTGAVGRELARLGFAAVDGLDLSPEMLAIAENKAIYRQLFTADLNRPLALADASYSAAVSAGTFTTGHVSASALDEVSRILRPGGLLACVIAQSFWHAGGFAEHLARDDVALLHDTLEPITQGGEPAGRMIVLRFQPR